MSFDSCIEILFEWASRWRSTASRSRLLSVFPELINSLIVLIVTRRWFMRTKKREHQQWPLSLITWLLGQAAFNVVSDVGRWTTRRSPHRYSSKGFHTALKTVPWKLLCFLEQRHLWYLMDVEMIAVNQSCDDFSSCCLWMMVVCWLLVWRHRYLVPAHPSTTSILMSYHQCSRQKNENWSEGGWLAIASHLHLRINALASLALPILGFERWNPCLSRSS